MNYSNLKFSWTGEILAKQGYGQIARKILKPLIEGGADVKLLSDEAYVPPEKRITDPWWLDQLAKSSVKPDVMPVNICYSQPNLFKPIKGAINIGYCQWETSHLLREWVPYINGMQRFWVGTPSLLKTTQNSGIKVPTDIVCPTLDTNLWSPDGEVTNITEIPKDTIKFMFVGDWIPRKNYLDLIIGYITAFSGSKDTALIVKTWSNQPGIEGRKNIEQAVRHFSDKLIGIDKPRIYLLTDHIDDPQMISLMRGTDCYISVSHGEGYDSAMVQAMSLEKLVVTTNFLAHDDYIKPNNSLPVKYSLTPVFDAGNPHYQSYQLWSNPDMWDFVIQLRQAYHLIKSGKHKDLCKMARKTAQELFSIETNTPRIARAIELAMGTNDAPKSLIQKVVSQVV